MDETEQVTLRGTKRVEIFGDLPINESQLLKSKYRENPRGD